MSEQLEIQVSGSVDHLMALLRELRSEYAIGSAASLKSGGAPAEVMGSVSDTITVAVGSGGAITLLISVINTWIRSKVGEFHVRATSPSGSSIEVSATQVRGLDAAEVRLLSESLTRQLLIEPNDKSQ